MALDPLARVLRILGAVVLVAVLGAGFTPAVNVIARWARPEMRIQKSDAIVILGAGASVEGALKPASLVRLVHGVLLYRRGFAPLVIISGTPNEARSRANLAVAFGVPPAAIVGDIGAHTTRDEARRIGALLRGRGAKSILLVTNTQHLSRASRLFEREGLLVNRVPADSVSESTGSPELRLELLRSLLQELLARAYYRMTGAF